MLGVADTVAVPVTSVVDRGTDPAAVVRLNEASRWYAAHDARRAAEPGQWAGSAAPRAVVQSVGHSGIPIPLVAIRSWLPSRGPIPNRA